MRCAGKLFLWLILPSLARADYPELQAFRAMAFTQVVSARVARIEDSPKAPYFHGYALVSSWQALDGVSRAKLGDLLRGPIDHGVSVYSRAGADALVVAISLCFYPGYAVHLETDRGPRDFLICFHCQNVHAFAGEKTVVEFCPDAPVLSGLKKLYDQEFPNGKK